MNSGNHSYTSSSAVDAAIKDAAKLEHKRNPERLVDDLIRQAYYDRFLCRIFSKENGDWVLKGGSAMLARIPQTRRTLDADLFREGYNKDQSLSELKRLAAIDLHDFFHFEFGTATDILQSDNQPYEEGYRVSFITYLGAKKLNSIHVDLVTHHGAMPPADVTTPANRIELEKLTTFPYRLYPITSQFADKACATVEKVNGKESSRIKDLVDLAIIATTQDLSATQLTEALRTECTKRRIPYPLNFTVPAAWRPAQFKNTASGTGAADMGLNEATHLIHRLLEELYRSDTAGHEWRHEELEWR